MGRMHSRGSFFLHFLPPLSLVYTLPRSNTLFSCVWFSVRVFPLRLYHTRELRQVGSRSPVKMLKRTYASSQRKVWLHLRLVSSFVIHMVLLRLRASQEARSCVSSRVMVNVSFVWSMIILCREKCSKYNNMSLSLNTLVKILLGKGTGHSAKTFVLGPTKRSLCIGTHKKRFFVSSDRDIE